MANSWNIPTSLEKEIRDRDKSCVYCGVKFTPTKISKKTAASWEHIINDATIITKKTLHFVAVVATQAKAQKSFLTGFKQSIAKNVE